MPPPRKSPADVDRLFAGLPASYAAIAVALRAAICRAGPSLVESVKWSNPFWSGASDVACLQCFPDHVNLGLLRGAELASRFPGVEGTGKAMRHVKVPSVAIARSRGVRRVLEEAVRLDASAGFAAKRGRSR